VEGTGRGLIFKVISGTCFKGPEENIKPPGQGNRYAGRDSNQTPLELSLHK
jgi:hypothetical protein